MEKNRSAMVISVFALVIAIAAISIGFAQFERNLTIESDAHVKADESQFEVNFVAAQGGTVEDTDPTHITINTSSANVKVGESLTITNGKNPRLGGISATFDNKFNDADQSASFKFYVHNNGSLAAYLNYVSFETVDGEAIKCTAKEGTDQELVDEACKNLSLSVSIKNNEKTDEFIKSGDASRALAPDAYDEVTVTIKYAKEAEPVDGDFDVEFGDIVFNYASQEATPTEP